MEHAVHTREQLQQMRGGWNDNYDYERREIMERTHSLVQRIMKEVLDSATKGQSSFTMVISRYLPGDFKLYLTTYRNEVPRSVDVLPYVLFYLQQQLPDSTISVTGQCPLEYLVVDWS